MSWERIRDMVFGSAVQAAEPDPELAAATERAQQRVRAAIHPRATSDPAIDRTWAKVNKYLPRGARSAVPTVGSWDELWDTYGGAAVLGATPVPIGEDRYNAEFAERDFSINPAFAAIGPDRDLINILAHEAQHIRQRDLENGWADGLSQFSKAYEDRPDEKEAWAAGRAAVQRVPRYPADDDAPFMDRGFNMNMLLRQPPRKR
jgi:hypothetical protein